MCEAVDWMVDWMLTLTTVCVGVTLTGDRLQVYSTVQYSTVLYCVLTL